MASANLFLNAPTVTLRGSDTSASLQGKLTAANLISIAAGDMVIAGGAAPNASALIDPTTVAINASGNLSLSGGSGNGSVAQVTGGSVTMLGANILLTGGAGTGTHALVEANSGGATLAALAGGAINFVSGTGANSGAGVVAAGAISLLADNCAGCVVLTANPYSPPTFSGSGLYSATGQVTQQAVTIPVVAGAGTTASVAAQDPILVLLVNSSLNTTQQTSVGTTSTSGSSGSGAGDPNNLKPTSAGGTGSGTGNEQGDGTSGTQKEETEEQAKQRRRNAPGC